MKKETQGGETLEQIQQKILKEVQLSDYYHMMFLKPFQCTLQQTKAGLPRGLKIVNRKNDLQYEAKSIKQLLTFEQFSKLSKSEIKQLQDKHFQDDKKQRNYNNYKSYCVQNNGDNLLCQMKMGQPVEIAICVCMYNEDKEMLNNTLLGVGQNIAKLCQQGVDPDKIVVIIIQDGIQKMDKSILDLFDILEAESGIRFGDQKDKKIESTMEKIQQVQQVRQNYSWDGEEFLDLNCFLFQNEQIQKRKKLRFTEIKKQYDEIKSLLVQVKKLQNDKTVTHQDLPQKVLPFFKQECKKFVMGDAAEKEGYQTPEQILEKCFVEVASNSEKSRPLIQNALTKASQYCKQYIESRMQMSHVSFFRTSQFFPQQSGYSMEALNQLKHQKSLTHITFQKNKSSQQRQEEQLLQSRIEENLSIKMNIFMVIKYKNAQKLSSHNWFFNGFCKQFSNFEVGSNGNQFTISPKYTVLLDVGLRPDPTALCKMYYALDNHQQEIGGVCGYMSLKLERTGQEQQKLKQDLDFFTQLCLLFVDIQRAQQLEYHFAHLIDKGFESIFKFIHVLPGAFSAYNMKAIWGRDPTSSDQLLQNYFKSIAQKVSTKKYQDVKLSFWQILARVILPNFIVKWLIRPQDKNAQTYQQLMYQSNVYLAEDRILCMGIHKHDFSLMFLPDAYSYVDPVKDIPALMGQRKRWINGSYFAFEKVSDEFRDISCCQILNIQIWYLSFMNMLAFVAPGFFLFSISVAMQAFKADVLVNFFQSSLKQDSPIYDAFVYTINFIYAMLIFGLIYYSINLTNRNQKFVRFVYGVSTILGIMSLIMLTILIVDLARGLTRGSSYLIANQEDTFIDQIPGGQSTVDLIRYVVLGIMGLYALPLILYSICFCNIRVIFETIAGSLSFAFYTPTYLIILNIYALCRMDDLSWGTKGLDSGASNKDVSILNTWKIIRTIHVGKLFFWNVIVAGFMIHFGSNYLIRFYLTFALMGIIAVTMFFKVICGVLYYFYYLVFIRTKKSKKKVKQQKQKSAKYIHHRNPIFSKDPTLFSVLKSKPYQNRSLIDELKEQIRQNIRKLSVLAGLQKQGGGINIMALQFTSMIQRGKNQGNKQQIQRQGSQFSKIFSRKQKVFKKIKQNLYRASKDNTSLVQPQPPPLSSPFNGGNFAAPPNQSDVGSEGRLNEQEGLFSKAQNAFKDLFNYDNKDERKPKVDKFHTPFKK